MNQIKKIFLYPQKSLRTMLTLWFLLFSLIPLTFITGYSLVQFEKVFSDEMLKRLNDNFIVISKSIDELKNYLKTSGELHTTDDGLVYNISTKNIPNLKRAASEWLGAGYLDQISLFDREGQLIVAFKKDEDGFIINELQLEKGDVFLTDSLIKTIKEKNQIILSDINPKSGFDLISYSKIVGKRKNIDGYIQETIRIDQKFIDNLKTRFNLDVLILDKEFKPIVSTQPDFLLIGASAYQKGQTDNIKFITIESKSEPYSLLIKPFEKEQENIKFGLASSKKEIDATTKRINKTVFSVVGVVILLILFALWIVSRILIQPLVQLMSAVKNLESGGAHTYIQADSGTEIGELTKSFNDMSKKVTKAQNELTKKVKELEKTNQELQEAQAQLVHTAKMGSLGQVVAGVAHELNNPIGFIYSNMGVLKDYIDRFEKLIEVAEKSPKKLDAAKEEVDYEYMMKDLPKLIRSCQDGAKRVRDIVLNLKNFSRSDELEKKEYDLEEGLESTLQILKSELKDIEVHTKFGKIPLIYCYAGQINQVFMNIVSNAIQAIDGKGEIWIETKKKGLEVVISIRDDGRGIPEKALSKIFDPFFTTKPVGKGTGLGLSISYGIIEKHNGQILVDSEVGKGTEFKIILPMITPKNT
ncbi:MAG: ATP-binding protein [Bdellovibrionota bacterium]